MHPFYAITEAALRARANGAVGAGCPGADSECPGADLRRDDDSVEWMLGRNPRLALARALNIDMVPHPFTIAAVFSSAAGGQVLTDQGPSRTISRDVVVYGIDLDIQVPSAYTADELKPLSDFFFDFTSGIHAALRLSGRNKRATRNAPLRAFSKFASPDEPWILCEEQVPTMDFTTTTPLPFAPATLTVTFLCKTPALDTVYRMNASDAYDCLEKLGYCVDTARLIWERCSR